MSVPDDASSLLGEVAIAVVVTPVANPQALAATCAIAKIGVDVVPSEAGALAVCRTMGGDGPAQAAGTISRLLRGVPVVLLERREGQIAASGWLDGVRGEDLAPGLVLGSAPEMLEDLLLGTTAPSDVDGVVSSVGMSRLKAMRTLAAAARTARRG